MFFFFLLRVLKSLFLPHSLVDFLLPYWFLFFIKWNRACKIRRTCLVELSNILNYFKRIEIEFFPQKSNRQCPHQQSLLSIDKKAQWYIIFHLLITFLKAVHLSFLIYKMGMLITLYSSIFFLIKWRGECKRTRTLLRRSKQLT